MAQRITDLKTLQNEVSSAIASGVISVQLKLKEINYDRELRGAYIQSDPRRSTGNHLKDGYEYDRSSVLVGGEKGRVEGGREEFIDFVHYPTRPVRRPVLD